MDCYYCKDESVRISATGTCVVCNYPTCSRPSGRSDNKFHGEICRYPRCIAFVCVHDTHVHSGRGTGHGASLPQAFPLLSVTVSLGALSAAEATFGSRVGAELDTRSNAALTEYVSFSAPEWRQSAITRRSNVVMAFVERGRGELVGLKLMKGEYFDAVRVAHLALNAAVMLHLAWRALNVADRRGFAGYLPVEVVRRIDEFAGTSEAGKPAEPMLQRLSARLDTFVIEALTVASRESRAAEELDFRIRAKDYYFEPSRRLLEMPTVLKLQAAAGMLGASA